MAEVLPDSLQPAAEELGGYFADSFGNATRIDYGTGGGLHLPAGLGCWGGGMVWGRHPPEDGCSAPLRMAIVSCTA